MFISHALRREYADQFMAAFADEISQNNETILEYIGKPSDIPKGSLLSSKSIFTIGHNPDGTFKKYD